MTSDYTIWQSPMKLLILLFHRVGEARGEDAKISADSIVLLDADMQYLCVIEILIDTCGSLFARPSLQARFGYYRKTSRRRSWVLIVQEDRSCAWYRSNVRDLRNQVRVDREGNASDSVDIAQFPRLLLSNVAIRVLTCGERERVLILNVRLIDFHD